MVSSSASRSWNFYSFRDGVMVDNGVKADTGYTADMDKLISDLNTKYGYGESSEKSKDYNDELAELVAKLNKQYGYCFEESSLLSVDDLMNNGKEVEGQNPDNKVKLYVVDPNEEDEEDDEVKTESFDQDTYIDAMTNAKTGKITKSKLVPETSGLLVVVDGNPKKGNASSKSFTIKITDKERSKVLAYFYYESGVGEWHNVSSGIKGVGSLAYLVAIELAGEIEEGQDYTHNGNYVYNKMVDADAIDVVDEVDDFDGKKDIIALGKKAVSYASGIISRLNNK